MLVRYMAVQCSYEFFAKFRNGRMAAGNGKKNNDFFPDLIPAYLRCGRELFGCSFSNGHGQSGEHFSRKNRFNQQPNVTAQNQMNDSGKIRVFTSLVRALAGYEY